MPTPRRYDVFLSHSAKDKAGGAPAGGAVAGGPAETAVASECGSRHKWFMQYRIRLVQSEEGWSVSCPSLPGCHSEGETREEAVGNIKIAIREWLEVEAEDCGVSKVEEDLVVV